MLKRTEPLYADEYSALDYTYRGVHFLFDFTAPYMFIIGNSGTGKTLLYNAAKDTMEHFYHVKAFTKADRDEVTHTIEVNPCHLFILDRADYYFTKELGQLIMEQSATSKFLIFARMLDNAPLVPGSLKEIYKEGNTLLLKDYV